MAVQKTKVSPSRRNMRRSHDALTGPSTAIEPSTGETHLRHHISPNGFLSWQESHSEKRRLNFL